MNRYDKLIFELSSPGKMAYSLPACDVEEKAALPEHLHRKSELVLPQVTEPEVVRHYTQLSMKNYGLDGGFYPLGSCTMKYNPKINEDAAAMTGFQGSASLSAGVDLPGRVTAHVRAGRHAF